MFNETRLIPLWRRDNQSVWIEGDPPENVERYQRIVVPSYSFPAPARWEVKPSAG